MEDKRAIDYIWVMLLLSVAGIIFQYVSFHPCDLGFFGWFCLVPWIIFAGSSRTKLAGWLIYLSSLSLNLAQLRWMTVADFRMIGTWLLLAWWCSLFPWIGFKCLKIFSISFGIPFAVSVPVVWVSLEYAKSFLLTGFPWYFLAHTQHSVIQLLQCADFSGTQGLSFIVGMVNGLIVDVILKYIFSKPLNSLSNLNIAVSLVIIFLVLNAAFFYGTWRLNSIRFQKGPVVALLQGNHAQSVRNNDEHFQQTWNDYKSMIDIAKTHNVDLIVWPETSFPFELPAKIGSPGPLLGRNDEHDIWSGPPQLLGVNVTVVNGKEVVCRHNSSMLQNFQTGTVTRYDKIHRVPFGEYIPFKNLIPAMNWLSPYDFDYSIQAGTESTKFVIPFQCNSFSFKTLLCYEDSDFALTRWAMKSFDPPDFLVNQSNDGWFQGTEEQAQHLAVARFRCVETRRAMVRAVNTGISAIIDPVGVVLTPKKTDQGVYRTEENGDPSDQWCWNEFVNKSLILIGTVPLCNHATLYVRFGDWLAWICIVLTLLTSLCYLRIGRIR